MALRDFHKITDEIEQSNKIEIVEINNNKSIKKDSLEIEVN